MRRPTPMPEEPEIIETLKPTIRLGDQLLQWADVIAVAPVKPEPKPESAPPDDVAPTEVETAPQSVSEQPADSAQPAPAEQPVISEQSVEKPEESNKGE